MPRPPRTDGPRATATRPRRRRTDRRTVRHRITSSAAGNLTLDRAFLVAKTDTLIDRGVTDHPEWIQGLMTHLQTRVHPFSNQVAEMLDGCDTPRPTNAREVMVQVTSLLTLPNVVRALAWRKIGGLLLSLPGQLGDAETISNESSSQKNSLYQELATDCGCARCTTSLGDSTRPPCATVQFTFKVVQQQFTNVTKSHLEGCKGLFCRVHTHSPLMCSGLVPPTSIKWFVAHANPLPNNVADAPLSPPPAHNVADAPLSPPPPPPPHHHNRASFPPNHHHNHNRVAVQYVDGDGGYLVADFFPEIAQLAHTLGVPCQKVQPHGLTLLPFREKGQDSPELGHVYHIDMGRVAGSSTRADSIVVPFGYHALVHARRLIAQCTSVIVVPHGRDARGGRLVVEIYRQSQDTLNHTVPTGVERIQAGLSYPYGDDRRYMQAYNIAQRNGVGLHQYHLVDDRLLPGALKQQLQDNLGARVTHKIPVTNNDCVVINENTYLNESHVLEMTSTIPGAGMAAFLRPTPPDRHAYVIPVGARICLYSDQLVNEAEQVNTDYLLVREAYGRKAWNPLVPDGANFGRLVNQGGLEEGLKALVASCDVTRGSVRFSAGDAETVFMAKSNVTYKYNCNNLATMGRKHQLEATPCLCQTTCQTTSPSSASTTAKPLYYYFCQATPCLCQTTSPSSASTTAKPLYYYFCQTTSPSSASTTAKPLYYYFCQTTSPSSASTTAKPLYYYFCQTTSPSSASMTAKPLYYYFCQTTSPSSASTTAKPLYYYFCQTTSTSPSSASTTAKPLYYYFC
eukprot:Em0647g2a